MEAETSIAMAEPIGPRDLTADDGGSLWSRALVRNVLAIVILTSIGLIAWRSNVGVLAALEHMRSSNVWSMAHMIAVFIAARWFGGEVLRQALAVLGHHIEKSEAFFITIVRTYAGLVIPKAGYGAAGVYLKVKHGVDFAKSGSLLLPILLLQCTVIGPLGLMALGLLAWHYDLPLSGSEAGGRWWWWGIAFLGTTLFGFSIILVQTSLPSMWTGKVAHFARRFGDAWRQISSDRGLISRLLCLHVLLAFLRALRLQFAFHAVAEVQDVQFLPILVASLLADIAFIVSPTPNGLGTRELVIGLFFATMPFVPAVNGEGVLSAVLLDRIVTTLIVIIFAQIGLVRVSNTNGNGVRRDAAESSSKTTPSASSDEQVTN